VSRALALALAVLCVTAQAQPVADALPRVESVRLGEVVERAPEAARVDPLPDEWLARDKAMHLGASFLLTLAGQYVLTDKGTLTNGEALPVAAGSALAIGLAKEVMDSRRPRDPHFCWRDLAADAAGVALAAAVIGL
jgi:uncharacterized protein YfiM (DUF2279 family)